MADYKNFIKKEDIGRIQRWLITGPDSILAQDALEIAYEHVYSLDFNVSRHVVFGNEVDRDFLHSILMNIDLMVDRVLVVMFDADKYKYWDELAPILRDLPPNRFFIATAGPQPTSEEVIHCFDKSKKAAYIKCKPLKREDLMSLLHSRLNIDSAGARLLIERSRDDLEWLFNLLKKLEYFPGFITVDTLERAVKTSGTPNASLSLLTNNKRDFLISKEKGGLSSLSINGIIDVISKAYLLNESMRTSKGHIRVISEKTSLKRGEIERLRPLIRFYDRTNTLRKLKCISTFKSSIITNKWAALALISRW